MKTITIFLLTSVCLLAQPNAAPQINGVSVGNPPSHITITGARFGAAVPLVSVGDSDLAVSSHSDTLIVATLPTLPAGTYAVRITNEQNHQTASMSVAIGMVGPQGPAGPQGPPGPVDVFASELEGPVSVPLNGVPTLIRSLTLPQGDYFITARFNLQHLGTGSQPIPCRVVSFQTGRVVDANQNNLVLQENTVFVEKTTLQGYLVVPPGGDTVRLECIRISNIYTTVDAVGYPGLYAIRASQLTIQP